MEQQRPGRLESKTALVTGATGHLGSAMARALASHGADLVLTSRSAEGLERLAADVSATTGRRASTVPADLRDPGDIDRLAERAWELGDGIDIVVSNAVPPAADLFAGDILTTPEETWESMHEIIVWAPLRLMRALAPRMIEARTGSIITVVSWTGLTPSPGLDAYGLAKGSLLLLTKYMAKEWGPYGIRANAVNPGGIATHGDEAEMTEQVRRSGTLSRISMGRIGTSRELVDAVVFLASDEASFVSGQLLSVDGARF